MQHTLKEIGRLLADFDATGSFAARCTAPASNLRLEVEGVGRIALPVTAATARKLCAVARPARHGYKTETRLDRSIRDSWEIPRSRLSIDRRKWNTTLAPVLERARRGLGLPETCRLEAELHNLLVYAPGQFFAAHQDSEKTDDMIGTLVVGLPSRFTGGSFVIEHHGEAIRVGGSERQLTFVAFYADCRHEVRPVERGYRIALTYNLIASDSAAAGPRPARRIDDLTRHVRDFFAAPVSARAHGGRPCGPPDQLVYLLDHQYTQRGLGWTRLKNVDAGRAAMLQEVAQRLDCEIFLALADVHETWDCEDEEYGYGSHRSGWGHGDEDEYDGDDDDDGEDEGPPAGKADEPDLVELLDSDVELRHWISPRGSRPRMSARGVAADELCYTKPSVQCEPFQFEHQGYMGNWGNTVERWYHRAAVVLWPRERGFVIRAKAAPRWAMGEISRHLRAGHGSQAAEMARRLMPFWHEIARRDDKPGMFDGALAVAAGIDDAHVASALLEPFTLLAVMPKSAPRLLELLERHGLEWCRALLRQWTTERPHHHETPTAQLKWLGAMLPAVCRRLCAADLPEGRELAAWLLEGRWAWMQTHLKQVRRLVDAGALGDRELVQESSQSAPALLALIDGSRIAGRHELHAQLIDCLTSAVDELPVQWPLGVLRAAQRTSRADTLGDLALQRPHERCRQILTARLAVPTRVRDDWSIRATLGCSCQLCKTLSRFLGASGEVRLEWPLAKEQRRHVHGAIDSRRLPVRHVTRRSGRPFVLVLEKTRAVFERDAAERRFWADALEWLEETADAFRPAS